MESSFETSSQSEEVDCLADLALRSGGKTDVEKRAHSGETPSIDCSAT